MAGGVERAHRGRVPGMDAVLGCIRKYVRLFTTDSVRTDIVSRTAARGDKRGVHTKGAFQVQGYLAHRKQLPTLGPQSEYTRCASLAVKNATV